MVLNHCRMTAIPECVGIFWWEMFLINSNNVTFTWGWTFRTLLVVRYFFLVARYFLLVAHYFLLFARCFLLQVTSYCEIKLLWTETPQHIFVANFLNMQNHFKSWHKVTNIAWINITLMSLLPYLDTFLSTFMYLKIQN